MQLETADPTSSLNLRTLRSGSGTPTSHLISASIELGVCTPWNPERIQYV